MPLLNRTEIRWQAPTENVDGTAIDYELAYELGVRDAGGEIIPKAVFPGRLNPDGSYSQATSEVFDTRPDELTSYTIALRAFNVAIPEDKSAWSNQVVYEFLKPVPRAPFLLD